MTQELEYQISQYLDGQLPPAERTALETRLAADAEAQQVLAEYRHVDELLRRELPALDINEARLAELLSDAVDAEADRPVFSFSMLRGVAAAAAVVIMALGIWSWVDQQPGAEAYVLQVAGPQVEVATAAPVQEIRIGPAAMADGAPATSVVSDALLEVESEIVFVSASAGNWSGGPDYLP